MFRRLAFFFALTGLLFTGCNEIKEESETDFLSIDKESVSISNALGGFTTEKLTVSYTGSSSLEWFSADKAIITVSKVDGNTATIMAQGKAGSAKVGVRTSDGNLEAFCMVSVSLSNAPALPVEEVTVLEDSVTSQGFTLNWIDSLRASAAVIDIFESEEARSTAIALAESGADTGPENCLTYIVKNGMQTFTAGGLKTDATGKTYYLALYGYLNGRRSTKAQTLEVQLAPDTTAPSSVKDVSYTATDHAVTITWADPDDEDYAGVIITLTSPANDFKGNAFNDSDKVKKIGIGTNKVTFTGLASGTEHNFTFASYDINDNTQGDENNTASLLTESFTTLEDVTPPSAVISAQAFGGRTSVTLKWTDPSDSDLKEIRVYKGEETTYKSVPLSAKEGKANSCQIANLDSLTAYDFTLKTCDYDGNESAAIALSTQTTNPVTSNVEVEIADIDFTNLTVTARVSWQTPSAVEYNSDDEEITYSYRIDYSKDSETVQQITTETGASYKEITGLSLDSTYSFTVVTLPSDTGEFTGTESSASKNTTILFSIKNAWGGRVLVPFKTAKEDFVNCVIVQDDSTIKYNPSVMLYPYWILRSPLNGAAGSFSLEAASPDGSASGLYLYFSETAPSGSTDYDVDNTTWGSGGSPHAFTGTVETVGSDIAGASFALSKDHSSGTVAEGYSSWKTIKCNSKFWYSGNSNPHLNSSESTSNNDYAWCYKIIELE